MNIWIDLRFLQRDNLYSLFASEIVKQLTKNEKNKFSVFLANKWDINLFNSFVTTKIVKEKAWSLIENITLKTQFSKEKFDLMIFFNEFKPITYKWKYILIIPTLQNLLFWNFKNSFSKYYYLNLLKSNLKNSQKIICFDKYTQDHINERFNIKEEKIKIIKWFFPIKSISCSLNLDIDIKSKHNLKDDYIIYDSIDSNVKNLEKVFSTIKALKKEWKIINLLFLWKSNSNNIEFRKMVIEKNINELVIFVWETTNTNKEAYYKQSLGVIFSNLYETFPFDLNYALVYKIPILSSKLDSIKELFWDKIQYFNTLSNTDTYEKIKSFIWKTKKEINYDDIISSNNSLNYAEELNETIEKILL